MMISPGPMTRQHIKLEVLETQCSPFQVPCFIWWYGWRRWYKLDVLAVVEGGLLLGRFGRE